MNIKFYKIIASKEFITISFKDSANKQCYINLKFSSLVNRFLKSLIAQGE